MKKHLLSKIVYLVFRNPLIKKVVLTVCSLIIFLFSDAQQWNVLGNEAQISSVASAYTAITVLGNIPYVVYVEGTSSGTAK